MERSKDCNYNDGIQIVTSSMSDRYPYANDPSTVLRNMDYKDWLVINQGKGHDAKLPLPEISTVNTGVAIVATLLWTFGGPITAAAGGVICAFTTLFTLLIPDKKDPQLVWKHFMNDGETFFGKKIQENERNRALAYLEAINKKLTDYEFALEAWKKDKNKINANRVSMEFNDVEGEIVSALPHLKLKDYEPVLLSCYAAAAMLHLNLLQQGIALQDEWDKYLLSSRTSNFWEEKLGKCTAEYIDHCTKTYQDGLNILRKDPKITWTVYNEYQRVMTLTVLDLIALFPNYDRRKYPMGTKTELTREVYTDLNSIDDLFDLSTAEKSLRRKPHLFSWLNGVKCATRRLSIINNSYSYTHGIHLQDKIDVSGGQLKFEKIPIHKLAVMRGIDRTDHPNSIEIPNPILQLQATSTNVDRSSYWIKNIYIGKDSFYKYEGPSQMSIGMETNNVEPHILSYIAIMKKNIAGIEAYNYSFAWTHPSVDRHNTIAKDVITQIPAVKALNKNDDFEVGAGIGYHGGDVIYLYAKSQDGGLQIKCVFPDENTYKMRLLYASYYDTNLEIDIRYSESTDTYYKDIKKTYHDGELGKYGAFSYLGTNVEVDARNRNKEVTIAIKNSGDAQIVLDRLEFIPQED